MHKPYLPYNLNLKVRAKELRNKMTAAERKPWYDFLRYHKHRFLRQKPIGNYIVDFYCSKLGLVIEVDGESHLGGENELHDNKRTNELKRFNLKILRFWNDEVLNCLEGVAEKIDLEIVRIENPPNPL